MKVDASPERMWGIRSTEPRMPRSIAEALVPLVSFAIGLLLTQTLATQGTGIAPTWGTAGPARVTSGEGTDVLPAPVPISVEPRPPAYRLPPLPRATSPLPQPDSPPSFPVQQGPGAPCDIAQFTNGDPAACPASCRHVVGSPSAASRPKTPDSLLSTGFVTGNSYATRSTDSGANWTPIDPLALFGSIDGGFCCNQRVLYEPSRDITIWYMQYAYSATTQRASVVIAVAVGANIDAGANGIWQYWRLDPGHFGRGPREALDFPDVALSANHLYCTSNVWNDASQYQDSIVWKMPLDELLAGGTLNLWYWRRAGGLGGGPSYRFTQGAEGTMRLASHNSTASMRIFRNDDLPSNSPMPFVDRAVPTWSDTGYRALAPNGVNWLGNADGRITSGYTTRGEYGFLWTSAAFGGQTQPHVRIARFRPSDDALVGTDLIWNNSFGWAYAACQTNLVGDVGIVLAFGDATGAGTFHPSTVGRVRDDCDPAFSGGGFPLLGLLGVRSPSVPYWGDYFSVQRHEPRTLRFVTATMSMNNAGDQRPRWVSFGRERDAITTPSLGITSAPEQGVAISVFQDALGKASVTTPGYTTQGVNPPWFIVRAPWTFTSGSTVFAFCNWRHRDATHGAWIDDPPSMLGLAQQTSGRDAQAEAVYTPAKQTTIGSRNPSLGVSIVVSRTDVQGNQNGATPFARYYKAGSANLMLTAAVSNGTFPFNRWYINGVPQAQGLNPVTLSMAGEMPVFAEADYCTHTHGSAVPFGVGCVSSTGRIPSHFTTSHPDAGTTLRYEVTIAPANAGAVLVLGFSNTQWGGIPLPLNLGPIGANPSCNLNVEPFLSLGFVTDLAGHGFLDLPLGPTTPVGLRIYTQTAHLDLGASAPLKLIVSNGLTVMTGGDVCN